jgi:hypothetical protein
VIPETPMTSAQTVDAILQVIDGLEAAASIGILHRDIKPSNCFVHRDGRVLVGDFGLSVAASGDEKSTGTILGTPGFASPEQLRGASLDVRSDIYSVGATIFYLLAGRAPFVDRDTTSLLKRVAAEPPPLLTTIRPDLPRGLAAIVAKCLARTPAERYPSYAALRAALEPFGSALLAPAPIIRRTVAGLIDGWFISLSLFPANLLLQLRPVYEHRADGYILAAISLAVASVYYGVFEGRWGAGAGKALLGLRVVDAHHVPPGFRRAVIRTLAFDLPTQLLKPLAATLVLLINPEISAGFVSSIAGMLWLTVLFSRARRKNGFTALHDRATHTRVVRRRARAEARDRTNRAIGDLGVPIDGDERIGPFVVPDSTPIAVTAPTRIVGFDDRLHRRVWIELLPPGTVPVPARRRDLGRPARLRWLAGRRDGRDCWDAYEAVDGAPFTSLSGTPQPWSRVRHWLSDLVSEVAAAAEEGPLPPLLPERVWIGTDGHARILEWPALGHEQDEANDDTAGDLAGAQKFLCTVATAALTGTTFAQAGAKAPETPLPLRARSFLLSLRDAKFASASALLDGLKDVAETPAAISKSRRATQLAACGMFPVIVTAIAIGSILVIGKLKGTDQTLFRLEALLDDLEKSEKSLAKNPDPAVQQKHDDIEVYLAEHMAEVIRNPATWESKNPRVGSRGGKERARLALARHPARTAEEIRRADATVAPILESQAQGLEKLASARVLTGIVVATLGGTFIAVAFFAGVGALVTGSGFTFRPFGVALVNRRGKRISRARALWRAVVTWSPMIALAFVLKRGPDVTQASTTVVAIDLALVAVVVAGAIWASQHPARGIQDRLAGTWLVPR